MSMGLRNKTAFIICCLMVFAAAAGGGGYRALAAENEPAALDIAAATAYARAHWNDGKGYCSEFCSDVLKAGGFVISGSSNRTRAYTQYNHLVNELGLRSYYLGAGKITQNADKIEEGDLVMWDLSYRLKGATGDTVNISGSGGHIVYVSVANGPFSRFCAHNKAKQDAVLETGGTHGMWLIKTSALAGNETPVIRNIEPVDYEVLVTGNIHMSPNGVPYAAGGIPETTAAGSIVTIDMTCVAGEYTWGRLANSRWDWIAISHGRVRDAQAEPEELETSADWTGFVEILIPGNIRNSPYGRMVYEITESGNIRAMPFGDFRGDATTRVGELLAVSDIRYEGGWMWGRIDNNGWDWFAMEKRDGSDKRYEPACTIDGEIYNITAQKIMGGWVWGRLGGTGNWIAIENIATGDVRCVKLPRSA